ncbi:hypothetical protein CP873_04905 [Cutibacterium acnes]|nr:hypothetical protein CP871_02340 [Cutibacterium acnes]REB64422.1 hypothetical protein CP873_04905 [Cutibacterium acnes]
MAKAGAAAATPEPIASAAVSTTPCTRHLFPRNIIVPFAAEPVSAAKGCYKVSTEAVKTSRLAFIVV